MHVKLHVYPVTHDIGQAVIVAEAMVAGEVRDDRVQLEAGVDRLQLGPHRLAADQRALVSPRRV